METELLDKRSEPDHNLTFDNLTLDMNRFEVYLNDELLLLKPKEFDLLHYLAMHPGKTLSRDVILQEVWGWDFGGGSRSVDVHIRWLREKIEVDPSNPKRIVTVRGIGYRFEG
jgi:DNA-binding response OmpR family regulator